MNPTASTTDSNAVLAILGLSILAIMLIAIVLIVLLVIARWKMFTKAGEAGWKSLIPIYSGYITYKLCWDTKNFIIFIILSVISSICGYIAFGAASTSVTSAQAAAGLEAHPIPSILCTIAGIAIIVWEFRFAIKTAKAYGKGTGMGVLNFFFPSFVCLILGFGKSEYVGPQIN